MMATRATQATIDCKRAAAQTFADRLITLAGRDSVAEILLFGSVAKGTAVADSDVDVLVVGTRDLNALRALASDAQMEAYERHEEGIEYLVYPLERRRYPTSYFLRQAFQRGEALYRMDDAQLRRQEAENYRELSETYLEGAQTTLDAEHWRLAIDAAYNAAELCVKGLLLLEIDELPRSHGGLVGEFGRLYVKSERVPKALGRQLNVSLELRNRARYEYNADVARDKAEQVISLIHELQEVLDHRLSDV